MDRQMDSKLPPNFMFPFCYPRSICFLESSALGFMLTHFYWETSRHPALKEVTRVPSVAALSPSTSVRMSVSKGVPKQIHPGSSAPEELSAQPSPGAITTGQ